MKTITTLENPKPQDEAEGIATLRTSGLFPCPFCGGEASSTGTIKYSDSHQAWWEDGTRIVLAYFCNCTRCGINNQGMCGHQTEQLAIKHWNTRTPGHGNVALSGATGDSRKSETL